ncbi:hypothetical protein HS088_TW13G01599 [Tripterygium wilfordii]|uniref:Uncharacterized protein n=1 Tax=Tripterygium wilfordii TaxID=458696 RepID=A0A7J7CXG3_TRIWF|nr:hypothetical protein HS088_TW13G01599 [Tripterygium wilfordii]
MEGPANERLAFGRWVTGATITGEDAGFELLAATRSFLAAIVTTRLRQRKGSFIVMTVGSAESCIILMFASAQGLAIRSAFGIIISVLRTPCGITALYVTRFCCPICSRSVIDMSKTWKRIDEEVRAIELMLIELEISLRVNAFNGRF